MENKKLSIRNIVKDCYRMQQQLHLIIGKLERSSEYHKEIKEWAKRSQDGKW